jgi:hypothetical protein
LGIIGWTGVGGFLVVLRRDFRKPPNVSTSGPIVRPVGRNSGLWWSQGHFYTAGGTPAGAEQMKKREQSDKVAP